MAKISQADGSYHLNFCHTLQCYIFATVNLIFFRKMKKILFTIISCAAVATAFAGGTNVNTNHATAYLRSVARGTTLDPDAVYHNPAGASFMKDGFHFSLNIQEAIQNKKTISTFDAFAYNVNNSGNPTKEYVGKTFAPVIPSFDLVWKKKRWAVMASFGIGGGGGSATYQNGLASFESMLAQIPYGVGMAATGGKQGLPYSMDMNIKGNSMTFQGQVGVSFRITDWLAVAAQARLSYASKSYNGYLKNIQMLNPTTNQMIAAPQFFNAMASQYQAGAQAGNQEALAAYTQYMTYAAMTSDHTLDVKQKGWAVSPVVALMFNHKGWAASVKYEFRSDLDLTTSAAEVSAKDPVIGDIFPDGGITPADMPALLAIAASRTFADKVTLTLEWHHYFDKKAQNSYTAAILGNTNEYLAGVEYTISDKWLVSAGYQYTDYNLNTALYSDLDFAINAHAVGFGFAYNFSEHIRLNAGVMKPFYEQVEKVSTVYNNNSLNLGGKDIFKNSRWAWGLGVDFHF